MVLCKYSVMLRRNWNQNSMENRVGPILERHSPARESNSPSRRLKDRHFAHGLTGPLGFVLCYTAAATNARITTSTKIETGEARLAADKKSEAGRPQICPLTRGL